MLDKRLQLGGLQVGASRTGQNPARFRVADNVYQTRDNYLVPRFHNEVNHSYTVGADHIEYCHVMPYKSLPFVVARAFLSSYYEYNGGGVIEAPSTPIIPGDQGKNDPWGWPSLEKLGCLFFLVPVYGLFKYDGYHCYAAGVPLPYISSAQYASGGATFMRVLQHKIDFQGNVVHSGYVQFPATPAANIVNIRHDNGATDIIGNTNVSPVRRTSSLSSLYDVWYFVGTGAGVTSGVTFDVTIPCTDKNVVVGAYMMVSISKRASPGNGLSEDSYGVALKVKSFDATHVVLDLLNVRYVNVAGSWVSGDMVSTTTLFSSAKSGSNYWMSAWSSNAATGNYVFKDAWAVLNQSTTSRTQAVDVTSVTTPSAGYDLTCLNLAGNMGDFYDVTSVKDIFPRGGSAERQPDDLFSFGTYGDLATVANQNEVFFSDTTLGGAFEMVNGLSFIVVGDGDDGPVQCVCGNSDFMVVSRQRNNYYVSGNLPSGNYRVSRIVGTQMGSYSNETMISFEDKILLLNKQGIWAVYAGARCDEVSQNIRSFFDDFSESYDFPEQTYWSLEGLPEFITVDQAIDTSVNIWIRVKRDTLRGFIYFLNPTGQVLVLNMNNGEFYTWSDLAADQTGGVVQDICAINGHYFVVANTPAYSAYLLKELKTGATRYGYGSLTLQMSWFTAGEPSLEKKLNQLKMWGIITATVDISHYLDWSTTASIDDGSYTNTTANKFSHKQRLNPANFQAVSVVLEVTPGTGTFQIEGFEVEFQPFQQGMKK